MRHVLAVAEREFVERKMVLAAGAVLAVLTLFTPLLPGVEGYATADVIGLAAAGVSLTMLFGGALVMGMTSINADLSERRFGFYFSRPISGLEIWLGKVAGALAVVIVTAGITLLPAALTGLESILETEPKWLALFAWCVLGVFFIGHVTACAARVRSVWLLLDFVGVFVLVATAWTMFRFYFGVLPIDALAEFLSSASLSVIVVAILIAMIASASGVLRGRVEPGRVHLWTSLTLWSLAALAIAGMSVFSLWIARAEPTEVQLSQSEVWYPEGGDGEWMVVEGTARGGLPQAFAARDGERFLRAGSRDLMFLSNERAIAGVPEVVFRFRPEHYLDTVTLVLADPSAGTGWRETKISYSIRGARPDVSPSGNRVAIWDRGNVAIYSLPDEQMVRALSVDLDRRDSMALLDDDRLLVVSRELLGQNPSTERYGYELVLFDVATGQRRPAVSFEASGYRMDPEGRLVLTKNGDEKRIIDIDSGATLGTFDSTASIYGAKWMSDGTIALSETTGENRRVLRLVDTTGADVGRVDLGLDGSDLLWLGSEPRPGVLTAVKAPSTALSSDRCGARTLIEIDTASGEVREIGKGLTRIWSYNRSVRVGSPASRTFFDCDGRIVRYDEKLERREVVLGGR